MVSSDHRGPAGLCDTPSRLENRGGLAYKPGPTMVDYVKSEQAAAKRFNAEDKAWKGPKFIGLGVVTLAICLTTIYLMSAMTGCSLQIVP